MSGGHNAENLKKNRHQSITHLYPLALLKKLIGGNMENLAHFLNFLDLEGNNLPLPNESDLLDIEAEGY